MTAMLTDLVAVVADEVATEAGLAVGQAGVDSGSLFDRLSKCGLLDIPELIAALLRLAEQERMAEAIRARGNGGGGRFLHGLAARGEPAVSAAAMALILGRSRRRDRFDSPRMDFNEVPAEAARRLVHAVAAQCGQAAPADSQTHQRLSDAAAAVLGRHDESRRIEALTFALVHALDSAGQLDEQILHSALAEGEVAILAEAFARRAGLDGETAWAHLARGGPALARLLRMAQAPRELAAAVAASLFETPCAAAEMIGRFDCLSDEEVERERSRLRLDRAYRDALAALATADGHPAD